MSRKEKRYHQNVYKITYPNPSRHHVINADYKLLSNEVKVNCHLRGPNK